MEQNKEQVFNIEALSRTDLKLLYEQIVQTAVMANTKTADGRNAMKKAINDFIKYVGNKRGIFCTYNFRNDTRTLSREEKEQLKKTDARVNFAYAQPEHNHIELSDFVLIPETLGDFAYYVSVIEHEFQHMVNNKEHNFYTIQNPFGLKMEYSSHRGALSWLTEFVKLNPHDFDFADEVLLNTTSRAIYFFDDNEVSARMCGLKAEQEFLKSAAKIAKKFGMAHIDAEKMAQALVLDEQEINFKQKRILDETQKEVHKLLYRLQKIAVETNNFMLAEALAETQDIKQLYNPMIYKNLSQFATSKNHAKLALLLDNSKYGPKVDERKLKADIDMYVESDVGLSRQDAFYVLFNHDQTGLASMFNQEILFASSAPRFITAQEYTFEGPAMPSDAQGYVDKIQAKSPSKGKHKADKIIVAKEVSAHEQNPVIVAKEEPEYNIDVLFEGNEPVPDTPEMPQEKTYDVSKSGIILPNEVDPDKPRRGRPRKQKIVESPLPTRPVQEEDFSRLFEIEVKDPKLVSAKDLMADETIADKAKSGVKKAKSWVSSYFEEKDR